MYWVGKDWQAKTPGQTAAFRLLQNGLDKPVIRIFRGDLTWGR